MNTLVNTLAKFLITKLQILIGADVEYQKFKKSLQREVNYLVKEFECKKSKLYGSEHRV